MPAFLYFKLAGFFGRRSHDNANRLIGITQGQTSVSYSYDAAGRQSSITLPNGVVGDYGYDVGSNLTSITYRQGANVIGNLTYEYNALRARTKVGGSLARTVSTPSAPLATYNAANQLVQRGTTTYTYDNNGNLLNDGANTYSWNARSQLSSITGGASASFQYDSFGRRTSKTVNSQSGQYLYDGPRIVQELSGGVPAANMLSGPGVDERHSCSCGGSNSTILTDALGSAVALTDSSGAVQTQYTYDAFGNTASSGSASSNSSQYTGRENDGTGLYYYRSRYYSPTLQRFISEDPIGFTGGDANLYAYVGNNPVNLTDPFGTHPLAAAGAVCLEGAIVGAAVDGLINALTGRKVTLAGLARSAIMGCGMALVGLGLGRLLGPMIGRMARAASARALASRASQVHEVLDPIAQEMRTTAAMATKEGQTIVGGSGVKDLVKAQREVLRAGEQAAKLPGAHAEITVMNHAAENGLTPTAIGVSRDICPVCAAAIESTGGTLTGLRTAIWPWP